MFCARSAFTRRASSSSLLNALDFTASQKNESQERENTTKNGGKLSDVVFRSLHFGILCRGGRRRRSAHRLVGRKSETPTTMSTSSGSPSLTPTTSLTALNVPTVTVTEASVRKDGTFDKKVGTLAIFFFFYCRAPLLLVEQTRCSPLLLVCSF